MTDDTRCQSEACSRLQPVEVHAVGLRWSRKTATPPYRTKSTHSAGHSLPQVSVSVMFLASIGQSPRPRVPNNLHCHPSRVSGLHSRSRNNLLAGLLHRKARHGTTSTYSCRRIAQRSHVAPTTPLMPPSRSQSCVLCFGWIL